MSLPPLRRPQATLGGCVWLPRFIDKCRLHLAGKLPADFQLPFCNPLAVDGIFLAHFGLAKEEIVAAVARAADDAAVLAWLVARGSFTEEKIAAWNALAPQIGKPGQPGARGLAWARQAYFQNAVDPRADSSFTIIAWDEGYLDEIAPRR